jgi:hypothetical protein
MANCGELEFHPFIGNKKPIGIDFSATHDTKSVPDNLTTEAVLTAQIRDATRFLKEVGIVKE